MNDVLPAAILVTALALSTAMAPTAAAGTATHSDVIVPSAFTPSLSTSHRFALNLSAGTSVDLALSWEDPTADLDILFTPPGTTCGLAPPETDCLVGQAGATAENAACMDREDGRNVGVGPATETRSASADGHDAGEATYGVWVSASTAVPLSEVAYTLEVTTGDDGHEDLDDGRQRATLLRSEGHCRTP